MPTIAFPNRKIFTQKPIDSTTILCYYIAVISITAYQQHYIEEAVTADNLTEMLKGVLEGCVMEIISRKQTYGYEITRQLNALGFADVVDGTVYTILLRLEKNKLVSIEKQASQLGPPRKFYSLNTAGQDELRRFWERWGFISGKINELKENQTHV